MIKSADTTQILDSPIMPFTRSKAQLSASEQASLSKKRAYHYKFEEDVYLAELIQTNPPSSSRIFDLNLLRVIAQLTGPTSSLIHISRDGLDNDYLSLFYENEGHLELMRGMGEPFVARGA